MMGGRRVRGARRRRLSMHLASIPIPRLLAAAGAAYLAAVVVLVVTKAPLGSAIFFAAVVAGTIAYGAVLARVWREPRAARRLLLASFALAAAMRIPMAVAPVGADSDMVRYQWDGRVQLLGYSPYRVLPADPSMAHTHTEQTARMPSRRDRTPYPPAAQLFFRLVVMVSDTTLAMKLALVACDLLTMIVLWRWLVATGRSEWLTLAYAWNPLVVFEIAHSGHIDALAALWIVTAAFWLSRRRTQLATVAFALAIATKLVPIVLAPLLVGRIRKRDAFTGALCLAALYLPFVSGSDVPLGAVPNVVDRVRFNGPLFSGIAAMTFPRFAAGVAVAAGLTVALWARWRLPATDPAAWAWPMAVAIAFAPVIYPWYLLCVTPFLFSAATLPLTAWTVSALSVYKVWDLSRHGGRWITPVSVMAFEFGVLVAAVIVLAVWRKR
jgi:alpha-1,6-mannosyltransferase